MCGQERVARISLLDSSTADAIARFGGDIRTADSIPSIRLIESQAALAYWSAWRALPITFPKNDVRRVPDHWLTFGARVSPLTGSPRLAANPPNAILNYLYAMLESEARLAAAALGLDPGLGVLHVDVQARDSLACDLMEPARPQIDAYLVDWITRQPLRREWFFEERNGNCRLMGRFVSYLSETAPIWARAVAPIAELVAQAFWNSSKGITDEKEGIPTRLTQRRRSEGNGKGFAPKAIPVPRQTKICEVCGAEGVRSRYCKSCAVEVARENMAQVALIGHSKPKTAKVKARISKTLSNHAVANTWWDPSGLPKWLTEKCYSEQIQPRLRDKKIRNIAEAIQVSEPYAALVRSGRRRPHPRHWQKLAELTGVSPDAHGLPRQSN